MTERTQTTDGAHGGHVGRGRHSWMMIACCIPMLAIAILLVATGVLGAGFLFTAVACTAMMALMMRFMNHGANDEQVDNHIVPRIDDDRHHHPPS